MARVNIKSTSSSRVVYFALAGNAMVAVSKFVAAGMTGSSAMLSEGFHSVVDTLNQILLLYGMHRGRMQADEEHPLGYGREIYFWSFVVALLLFTAGAGASIYEGIVHIRHPHPIENPQITYIVLGLATLFEGSSWVYALQSFKGKRKYSELFGLIVRSKDPPTFIVLLEDSAALIGILIAFLGVYFSVKLQLPVLDGLASIFIGITLGLTALLLTRETKGLLIGESPGKAIRESMLHIASQTPGIVRANNVVSVHVSPQEIMAALSVEFEDALRAPEIEAVVIDLENRIREVMPQVTSVFVKPETSRGSDTSAAYPDDDSTRPSV